jgi:hypothetical protein
LASSTGLPSSRRSKPSLQRRREPGNTLEGCSHARGVQQNQLGQHELLGASFELVFECANCGCLTFGDSTLFQNEIGRPLRRTSKATSVCETPLTAARNASLCVGRSGELLSRLNRPTDDQKAIQAHSTPIDQGPDKRLPSSRCIRIATLKRHRGLYESDADLLMAGLNAQ